jgi:hypothetical protein
VAAVHWRYSNTRAGAAVYSPLFCNNLQVNAISAEWCKRADIPGHVAVMLDNFPPHLHPMSQFIAAIAALNTESKFASAYAQGTLKKAVYWEVCDCFIVNFMHVYSMFTKTA